MAQITETSNCEQAPVLNPAFVIIDKYKHLKKTQNSLQLTPAVSGLLSVRNATAPTYK